MDQKGAREDIRASCVLAIQQVVSGEHERLSEEQDLRAALKALRIATANLEGGSDSLALEDIETWRLQRMVLFPFYIAVLSENLLLQKQVEKVSDLSFSAERRKACVEARGLYWGYLAQLQKRLREGPLGTRDSDLLRVRDENIDDLLINFSNNLRSMKISFSRRLLQLRKRFGATCTAGSAGIVEEQFQIALPLVPNDIVESMEEEVRGVALEFIAISAQWAQIRIHELDREIAALEFVCRRAESTENSTKQRANHISCENSAKRHESGVMYIDSHCSRTRYFNNVAELRGYIQKEMKTACTRTTKLPFGDCCLAHIHRDEVETEHLMENKSPETDFNDTHGARDVELEDQFVMEKRRWDLFSDEHRRGVGNRYRKG
jgi:hypothetical protein